MINIYIITAKNAIEGNMGWNILNFFPGSTLKNVNKWFSEYYKDLCSYIERVTQSSTELSYINQKYFYHLPTNISIKDTNKMYQIFNRILLRFAQCGYTYLRLEKPIKK